MFSDISGISEEGKGPLVGEIENTPAVKKIKQNIDELKKEAERKTNELRELYNESQNDLKILKDKIKRLEKRLGLSTTGVFSGDASNVADAREIGRIMGEGFVAGTKLAAT